MRVEIRWLEVDEDVEEHLAEHGVLVADVWEALANPHITFPNPEAEERIWMIGANHGGRLFRISLAPTSDPGTWRPITGWPASPADIKLYRRHVR
jgi:uncharacterized DUF497 family protein